MLHHTATQRSQGCLLPPPPLSVYLSRCLSICLSVCVSLSRAHARARESARTSSLSLRAAGLTKVGTASEQGLQQLHPAPSRPLVLPLRLDNRSQQPPPVAMACVGANTPAASGQNEQLFGHRVQERDWRCLVGLGLGLARLEGHARRCQLELPQQISLQALQCSGQAVRWTGAGEGHAAHACGCESTTDFAAHIPARRRWR